MILFFTSDALKWLTLKSFSLSRTSYDECCTFYHTRQSVADFFRKKAWPEFNLYIIYLYLATRKLKTLASARKVENFCQAINHRSLGDAT